MEINGPVPLGTEHHQRVESARVPEGVELSTAAVGGGADCDRANPLAEKGCHGPTLITSYIGV